LLRTGFRTASQRPFKEIDPMYKKVMWATDGSEAAGKAMPHAKSLASEANGELVIVHCEELIAPGPRAGRYPVHADEPDIKTKIEREAAELKNQGLDVSVRLLATGAAGTAQAIAEAAREVQAEVIVVGTRGHTALGGLLLGSVTQRLLHLTPCPVLAVPSTGPEL
jgi:nucleotide-binding universal stress UspA family protein